MAANLELVKSIFAEWEQGDFSSSEWADPEIELVMIGGVNAGTWQGRDKIAEGWGEMLSAWEHLRAVPERFHELEDGRVLVLLRNTGRGKGSGIDIRELSRSANVFTIRNGKVTSLVAYWDREQAISDLGLDDRMEA